MKVVTIFVSGKLRCEQRVGWVEAVMVGVCEALPETQDEESLLQHGAPDQGSPHHTITLMRPAHRDQISVGRSEYENN